MNAIERLSMLLDSLEVKARQVDLRNTQLKAHRLIENNNLFSSILFVSQSDKFEPYIQETRRRIAEFSRLVAANKLDLSKELLLQIEQQIAATANALNSNETMHKAAILSFDANNKVKIKKAKAKQNTKYQDFAQKIVQNSHQLYQKLAEHHEFERRLMEMVHTKEQERSLCKTREVDKLSAETLVLHQRLGRCRKAISTIERDIELAEKR